MLELAGHERRVGDEQYRAALPLINISNEVDDRLGAVLVKSPRRLVRENELLVRDQRACDRDALLLSTAQLFRGSGLEPVESDPHEHGVDHASMLLFGDLRESQGESEVFIDGEILEDSNVLVDIGDVRADELPGFILREPGDRLTIIAHNSGIGSFEQSDDIEQRRLSGPALAQYNIDFIRHEVATELLKQNSIPKRFPQPVNPESHVTSA